MAQTALEDTADGVGMNDAREATLKRQALDQKHLLEQYFTIYDAFQNFAERLKPYVQGEPANEKMFITYERFRLLLLEHQSDFLEWQEGVQVINEGVRIYRACRTI